MTTPVDPKTGRSVKKTKLVCVNLLLEVDSDAEAADALTGMLTEQLKKYDRSGNSCLLDWAYAGGRQGLTIRDVDVPEGYEADEDPMPKSVADVGVGLLDLLAHARLYGIEFSPSDTFDAEEFCNNLIAEARKGTGWSWEPEEDTPCVQVEYDLAYSGGDYSGVGRFAYIPEDIVDIHGSVEEAFKLYLDMDPVHIVHYSLDERYTPNGELFEDDEPSPQTASKPK